ncbi:hypothetical protein F5887DRAFT_1062393 [Amanita rubescens]|nr:hypothetical protein F5887DRAFT_1062393 [Amanita rubescens]
MAASKRKRKDPEVNSPDGLRKLLSSSITSDASAEVALLHIMEEHNFSPSLLRQILTGSVISSIVQDMDVLLPQYGPPDEHETEEATSRFLAPIFNHLVAQFDFAFRNLPELIFDGCVTTGDKIKYYFKAFGSIATRSPWPPVIGILQCDGNAFQFFSFDGSTKPFSFSRGTLPEDSPTLRHDMIIFDLLLQSYISSLDAYRNRSIGKGKSMHEWEEALCFAGDALEKFRAAERMRQDNLPDVANTTVQDAMDILKRRYDPSMLNCIYWLIIQSSIDKVPIIDKTNLIMSEWDDGEVGTI